MFEFNDGQLTDAGVRFLTRGYGYSAWLSPNEAILTLAATAPRPTSMLRALLNRDLARASVALQLIGANATAAMEGLEPQETKTNYFIGNDPAKWRSGVANFKKVRTAAVYPGIDVLFYGTQQQLEYDFVLAPHADPRAIALRIKGAEKTFLQDGEVVARTAAGDVRMRRPRIHQQRGGRQVEIAGEYRLSHGNELGFRIGEYDESQELVIDPVLSYALAFGSGPVGDRVLETALPFGITNDSSGNTYVSGSTCIANFAVTPGGPPHGGQEQPCHDVFVTKIDPTGSSLIYSTIIGGSSRDGAARVALDSTGAAYITGVTQSSDFPTTPNAFDRTYAGGTCYLTACPDSFAAKLSPDGSQLVYSTYLGGSDLDVGVGIAVNAAGNAIVVGGTFSSNFPVTPGALQPVSGGEEDIFLTKLSADGTALLSSTYFGGNDCETGMGIALDASENIYIAGGSESSNFPVTTGSGTGHAHELDVFIAKFNSSGAVQYSRLLGGVKDDFATNIVVDAAGGAYITGATESAEFPITGGAFQTTYAGGSIFCPRLVLACGDAFVAKFDTSGAFVWSTFFGGENNDGALSLALDGANNVWLTGNTFSTGSASPLFPLTNDAYAADGDTFVSQLSADGSQLLFSTLLNPTSPGIGTGISVDSAGNVYATGESDVPKTTAGVYSIGSTSPGAGYVVKFSAGAGRPAVQLSTTALDFPAGFPYAQTLGSTSPPQAVTLTNVGNAPLMLSFEFIQLGSGAPPPAGFSETDNCGSVVPASASCTIQVTYHPTSIRDFATTLLIHDNAIDGPHSIDLHGFGGSPELLITPQSVDFGGQTSLTTSPNVVVRLSDPSLAPFSVTGVTFTGPNASDFSLTGIGCGSPYLCLIFIAFHPGAAGPRSGTAVIADTEPGSPHTVALTGQGTNGPIAKFSGKSLGFGSQAVGTNAAQPVNLTNTGTTMLHLSQVSASGDFSVDGSACGAQVPPGNQCSLSVTFSPGSPGHRTGGLTVVDDAFDSPQVVTLDGYGIGAGPVLASSPAVLFGDVAVGMSSTLGQFGISNLGQSTLHVSGISITGDFSLPSLVFDQLFCASVAAGNSCSVSVVFTPTAVGARTGTLTITSDDPDSPLVLQLAGTGRSSGVAVVSPTTLPFGDQGVGTTSVSFPVTLTNTGAAAIHITNVAATAPFSVTNLCGATVAAGTSCTIGVKFAPIASVSSAGSLTITDDAVGGVQTVGLTGRGVSGPAAILQPATLDFGSQPLATTSGSKSVILTNSGTTLLTLNGIGATGDFSQTNNCPGTLAAGAGCTVNVSFRPTNAGSRAAILTVSDNGVHSPHIATLAGTGLAAPFTDDPLLAGITVVKVLHITELRTRIDAQRTRFGLAPFSWTDPSLTAGIPVKAAHLTELRTALQETYMQAGKTLPPFADPTPIPGVTRIKARNITELRAAVIVLEGI